MVQRPEQADGAHGVCSQHVAGVQAVHNAVYGVNHDQEYLVVRSEGICG